jgi:hypothetical protein
LCLCLCAHGMDHCFGIFDAGKPAGCVVIRPIRS